MKNRKFTTGLVRLSYANIWQPKAFDGGVPKYSASLLIAKSDEKSVKRINDLFKSMMQDEDVISVLGKNTKNIDLPLRDGDLREDSNYHDQYYLNAKANESYPPKIFNFEREEVVDKAEVYSGCYVQAVLTFYPYNKNGNKGIGVSLGAIRKIKDGEPFSSAGASASDFDDDLIGKNDINSIF